MRPEDNAPAEEGGDPFFQVDTVASATECTGIAPFALENDWQQTQTAALYAIHRRRRRADDQDEANDEDFPE